MVAHYLDALPDVAGDESIAKWLRERAAGLNLPVLLTDAVNDQSRVEWLGPWQESTDRESRGPCHYFLHVALITIHQVTEDTSGNKVGAHSHVTIDVVSARSMLRVMKLPNSDTLVMKCHRGSSKFELVVF